MLELILFILATVGMSHILVDGSIFAPFKMWLSKEGYCRWFRMKLLSLMNCYQCSGWWSGGTIALIMWFCGYDPLHVAWDWFHAPLLFVYACAGSYLSTMAAVLILLAQEESK